MVYRENDWHHKVLISRETLLDYHLTRDIGSLVKGNLIIYLSFQNGKVFCSKVDITEFYNNFDDFPIIPH